MKITFTPYNFARSPVRRFVIYVLIITWLAFLFAAIYLDSSLSDEKKTLWVIDTSLSMQVQDLMTSSGVMLSRLSVVRDMVWWELNNLEWSHGIMTFGSNAQVLSPLTDDKESLSSIISSLTPELYTSSSDLSAALALVELLYPDDSMSVILVTDGENMTLGSSGAIQLTGKSLTVIWVGTTVGWPMLQGYDSDGKPRYKQFEWKNALSRRDDEFLTSLTKTYEGNLVIIENAQTLPRVSAWNVISWMFDQRTACIFLGIALIITWLFLSPVTYHAKK